MDNTGQHDGGGGGGSISEWSSTIGIVTAIAGNALISFALNIQRYAHIRLHRDREHRLRELRNDRTEHEGLSTYHRASSSADYGTLDTGDIDGQNADTVRVERDHNADANGRDGVARNGTNRSPEANGGNYEGTNGQQTGDGDLEPMQRSFLSDRTITFPEKRSRYAGRKSYLRSPYWWAGLVLMVVGEAGNFLAYGFAPASIVSPLGVVALISNCVIAPFMLKEKFRQRDLWGVLVSIAGAVTVVLSARTSELKIGPGQIWGMITTWEFELYVGLTVALILGLMWVSQIYGHKSILIDVGLVGLFGGYTALSTKGVSSLLSYTLWHVITFPITYALVAILVLSAMMQIRYINRALQRFDSTQVIPTQFVLFTLSVIVGSAVLYRDFESTTLGDSLKFVGGCALTFLGVYLITSGRERASDLGSEETDEEEIIGLLGTETYHDRADHQHKNHDTGHQTFGHSDASSTRRAASSFSQDEDEDEEYQQRTPRVHLSRSTSIPSISDSSSLIKSRSDSPTPLPPDPWVSDQEEGREDVTAEPSASTATPSTLKQADEHLPPSQVLLRFPSAPGLAESSLSKSAQTTSERIQHSSPAKYATPHTPVRGSLGSRKLGSSSRTPLSLRFSPGPLLPTLSGGLSAVVADSLRRDEATPGERRRSTTSRRKRKGKKPRTETGGLDDAHAEGETEYETDDSIVRDGDQGEHQDQFGPQLRRPNILTRTSGIGSDVRANTQDVVPTLASTSRPEPSSDVERVRSLSDTWSSRLGRFGVNAQLFQRGPSDESIPSSPPGET